MKVTCLNCVHEFGLISASAYKHGWHTSCPECGCSFDIALPNTCEQLQSLCDYCRGTEVYVIDGYFELHFKCDPSVKGAPDTIAICDKCPKAGCHIHTAVMDAELILNGEMEVPDTPK